MAFLENEFAGNGMIAMVKQEQIERHDTLIDLSFVGVTHNTQDGPILQNESCCFGIQNEVDVTTSRPSRIDDQLITVQIGNDNDHFQQLPAEFRDGNLEKPVVVRPKASSQAYLAQPRKQCQTYGVQQKVLEYTPQSFKNKKD